MTGVLVNGGDLDTGPGRSHVKTEAETGVRRPLQAPGLPAAPKAEEVRAETTGSDTSASGLWFMVLAYHPKP